MTARIWLEFAVASMLLFVTVWIVLPGPTYALFVLSVAARETSAWLLVAAAIVAALAAVDLRRDDGAGARLTVSFALVACVLASLPLVQAPFAARRFESAMQTALGDDFLRGVPAGVRGRMRSSPLVPLDLLRGVATGGTRVTELIIGAPEGVPLRLIVYRPASSAGPLPSVVQIYGGGWRSGAPGDNGPFARYLASRGYVVFAIDYRQAPRWTWPAQLADVRAALAWIRAHAAEHGADATRLALIGRSAGAHLAMLAAYEPREELVRAVVSYYGPTDLAEGYRHPPRPDPYGVRTVLHDFLGGTPDELPGPYASASPVSYATRRLPPTLLIHGSHDHIVEPRFSVMLNERLRATGTTSILLEIPWAEHAFDAVPNGPGAQLALYFTERFLGWALNAH